ncbi:MAG: ABC transporter permease [Anaerolineae bacterium]|nr:ABC transporter permease [Anaerolineae bacterium]
MGTQAEAAKKVTSQQRPTLLRRMLQIREMGVLLALIVLIILISTQTPYFFTTLNIFNVLRSMSTVGIMAIGMTMIIVTAGIDLSVGSILAASAMLTARLMFTEVLPPWGAVAVGLGFGTTLGLINGLVITKIGVNPFITTLGMLSIGRGLTLFLASNLQGTVASNIPMRDESVNFLGGGYIEQVPIVGRIPFPVIEMFVLVVLFSLFMRYTVLGRQIYAVGSNETAARLSGVPVDRVKIFVYTITGTFCALTGVMNAGLLSTAAANAGQGVELDVIAAVVIGGASLMGGEGTIIGAIIGAAIMAILRNAFVLLHFPSYMQTITIGIVIIVAVAVDQLRRRQR